MQHTTRILNNLLRHTCHFLLLLLLTQCAVGPVIKSTYDPNTTFQVYQNFAWHPAELPPVLTRSGATYSALLDQQVKAAVESELVKIGLRPTDTEPGLLVAYDIALPASEKPEIVTDIGPGFGYGYSYWYGYRYRYDIGGLATFKSVTELPPGTLIIDLIDASTQELVWRGWYEAGIDPTATGDHDINKAVANVMSRFPPVPGNIK